jgi:Holliday junction DNA helicase RuvA
MLGFLRGKIISKNPDSQQCVVLTHRLGFEVTLPRDLFETVTLQSLGSFWIHSHVREDAFTLFGFASESDKFLFRILLGVSGLGPKTALSLLSEHGAERLVKLVVHKDSDGLSQAPGVGKKLAQKVILDLASKVEKLSWLGELPKIAPEAKLEPLSANEQLRADLTSALSNLGFVPAHIKTTLDKLFEREDAPAMGFAACLKIALKEMSGRARPQTEAASHG